MAEVGTLTTYQERGAKIYEWLLAADGYGTPIKIPAMADKSYAMFGTWDGASISLKGGFLFTNSQTLPFILHETDNTTAITGTADVTGAVIENPIWIYPVMSSKGATTSVRVVLVCR